MLVHTLLLTLSFEWRKWGISWFFLCGLQRYLWCHKYCLQIFCETSCKTPHQPASLNRGVKAFLMMLEFNLLKGNSPDWGQTLQIKSSIVSLLFAIKITIGGIIDLMSVLAYACQVTCISQLCSMNREEQKTKHYVPLPSPPFPCEGK